MKQIIVAGHRLANLKVAELHELLYSYDENAISRPRQMGDVHKVVQTIASILKIDLLMFLSPDELLKSTHYHCEIAEIQYPAGGFKGVIAEPKSFECSYPSGVRFNWELIGAVTAGNHAVAYVKNPKGWTCCNDGNITPSEFPKDKRMANFFYKKVAG